MKTYRLLYFLLIIFYITVANSQIISSSTQVDSSVENNQRVTIHYFNDYNQKFIILFDNNRRMINRSSFLERAKQWLNQSDRENKEWINNYLNDKIASLCTNDRRSLNRTNHL